MFYVNNIGYDHLDEATEVAKAVMADVTECGVTVFSYAQWNAEIAEQDMLMDKWIDTYYAEDVVGACMAKTLFNGRTLLYEADRLREVAAIRGVVTFDEFAKFHRRLIPLLKELGISLDDTDDARKARLESMAEG